MTRENNTPSYGNEKQQQKPSINPSKPGVEKEDLKSANPKKQPEVWADEEPDAEFNQNNKSGKNQRM